MKSKFIIILCVILCLIMLGTVSANTLNESSDKISDSDNSENHYMLNSISNDDELNGYDNKSLKDNSILSFSEDKIISEGESSFSDLKNDILNGGTVQLNKNYKYNNEDTPATVLI